MNECKNAWVNEMDHNLTDFQIALWVWKTFPILRWIDENERRVWELPLNSLLALDTNQKKNETGNCGTSCKSRSLWLVKEFDYSSKNKKSHNAANKITEKFPFKTNKITHTQTQTYTCTMHMHLMSPRLWQEFLVKFQFNPFSYISENTIFLHVLIRIWIITLISLRKEEVMFVQKFGWSKEEQWSLSLNPLPTNVYVTQVIK